MNFRTIQYCAALGLGGGFLCCGVPTAFGGDGLGVIAVSQYNELLGAGGLRFDFEVDGQGLPPLRAFGHVIEARDMNNDGVVDLFIGFEDFDFNILYALGSIQADGSVGFELHSYNTLGMYETATTCDLDGNGSADFVVRDTNTAAIWVHYIVNDEIVQIDYLDHLNMVYSNDSPGGYLDARTTVRGGDLDGDGLADLVMNTVHDQVVVRWSSRPDVSAFESVLVPQLGTHNVLYPLRDYDGDSLLDVLLLDLESEQFLLLSGTGSDSLMIPRDLGVPASGHVGELAYPVFGQFDTNPGVDLVVFDSVLGWVVVPNFAFGTDPVVPLSLAGDERVVDVPGDVDLSGFDDLLIVGEDPLTNSPGEIEEVSLVMDPLSVGSTTIGIETGNTPDVELLVDSGRPRLPRCLAINLDSDPENELLWLNDLTEHKVQDGFSGGYTRGWMIRASEQRSGSDGLPWIGASQIEGQKDPLHMLPIDVDGDGVDELFMVGAGTKGRIVDVDAGTFANVAGVNDGFMSVAADLGGDGSPEIVVVDVQNSVLVLPVIGDGTLGQRVLFANPIGNDYRGVVSADFDYDGMDDLLAVDQFSQNLHLWRGIGDAQVEFVGSDTWIPTQTVHPGVLDMDGDGFLDLVIEGDLGYRILINQQDGTFGEGGSISALIDGYWIITADLDQDGNVDIIAANQNLSNLGGGISVHFMGENGAVEEVRYLFYLANAAINEVIAGDFNGDGLLDLVGSIGSNPGGDASRNGHLVWAQTAGRNFEVHAVLPASASATVGMGDFNLDGAMDVATASDLDDSVRVHWGTVAGCEADLNGDGAVDFFDISELLNALPDFNGDGAFDFFDISDFLNAFAAGCP